MILADKIMTLRKKAGWSQDELAQKLNVTRQSVSKWEGAQSVPDMERIVLLSRLFGVTTDYLLKDELEAEEYAPSESDTAVRRVSMEEASTYLDIRKADASKLALATFLCIISPIALIVMAALSESPYIGISDVVAAGVGMCVMLCLVASAVVLFIRCSGRVSEFAFLKKEPFETEYGVSGMVKERKRAFKETASRMNTLGTVLCILSLLPLFGALIFNYALGLNAEDILCAVGVGLLLLFVAFGCYDFVYAGAYTGALDTLLEEGDYTRENKRHSSRNGAITLCYWLVITAVFLLYIFGPSGNGQPQSGWIIWAVGGILYAALFAVLRIKRGDK